MICRDCRLFKQKDPSPQIINLFNIYKVLKSGAAINVDQLDLETWHQLYELNNEIENYLAAKVKKENNA